MGRTGQEGLRTVQHCSSLKLKSKLDAVIHVNVRFAQNILPILVISSLFFCGPKSTQGRIAPL